MTIDNRDMSGIGGIGWVILLMTRDTRMFKVGSKLTPDSWRSLLMI